MPGAFTAVRHSIADSDISDRRMFVGHHSGSGVSQHGVIAELCPYFGQGAQRSGCFHYIEYLTNMRRVLRNLLPDTFLMNAGGFRPAANEGICGPDEQVMGQQYGVRNRVYNNFLETSSKHLFHWS